jgi:hypothetical protein
MNDTSAAKIVQDQRLTVKKGRTNGLGFEPCFNSFYDFYLDGRYGPLLQLEDVTFFLYLRKNLNDNIDWKMPSVRYIMRKFKLTQAKYYKMVERLESAKLLVKISGKRVGTANVSNGYLLHDPLSDYRDFALVFGVLDSDTPLLDSDTASVLDSDTGDVFDSDTHKQTSYLTDLWQTVLSSLPNSDMLLKTELLSLDGVAVVRAGKSSQWIEQQLSRQLLRLINIELVLMGKTKVTGIEFR